MLKSRGCAVGKDEVLSLPLPLFCLEAQTGLWQLRKPPFLLLQSLLGGRLLGPRTLKEQLVPKEIKGPPSFSSVAFNFLPLHSFLICEKLIILSVKSGQLRKEKNILDLTFPGINATGLKQFYGFGFFQLYIL